MSRELTVALAGVAIVVIGAAALSWETDEGSAEPLAVCANDAVRTGSHGLTCVVRCGDGEACLHPSGDPAEGRGARAIWNGRAVWLRVDGPVESEDWHHSVGDAPPADVVAALAEQRHGLLTVSGAADAETSLDVAAAWFARRGVHDWETVVAGRRASSGVEAALLRPVRLTTLGTGPRPDDGARCAALTGAVTTGICLDAPDIDCDPARACSSGACVSAALPEAAARGASCEPQGARTARPSIPRWDVWLAAASASTPAGHDTADGVAWGAAQAWRQLGPEARGGWNVVQDATLAGLWRAWAAERLNRSR